MLNICRSSFYYKSKPIKTEDLELMRLIDEQFLKTPTWGNRKMADWLWRHHGMKRNRKRIQRLMRLMGLEAIYLRPRTTRPHPEHKVYPYLIVSSSKGISSVVLARLIGVTQPTAWRRGHAIRKMMDPCHADAGLLCGIVEMDETYLGGRPKPGAGNKRGKGTAKQ